MPTDLPMLYHYPDFSNEEIKTQEVTTCQGQLQEIRALPPVPSCQPWNVQAYKSQTTKQAGPVSWSPSIWAFEKCTQGKEENKCTQRASYYQEPAVGGLAGQ